MDIDIRILVHYVHKHIVNRNRDCKFFLTLTNKCLLFGFAGLDLATNKLPQ